MQQSSRFLPKQLVTLFAVEFTDTNKQSQIKLLCSLIMNQPEKKIYESEEFEWLAKVLARESLKEVLNPPEFNREEDDRVARTKIMFYKPKQGRPKKA